MGWLTVKSCGQNSGRLRAELAPALGVDRLLPLMESAGFVVTPDIALKMLIINERRAVSSNVIIMVPQLFSCLSCVSFAALPIRLTAHLCTSLSSFRHVAG